jgi:uracil-DNA glycosylase
MMIRGFTQRNIKVSMMDTDDLVATLEYWKASGVDFLAGDKLEFSIPKKAPLRTHPEAISNHSSPPARSFSRKNESPPPQVPQVKKPVKIHKKSEPLYQSTGNEPLSPPVENDKKPALLEKLKREAVECTRCELHLTRKQAVFGVGSPEAPVLFIGEGPGADEDRLGEPFVGAAGKLLDKMLKAIGFSRQEIYIANVVKCRPPGNRNPLPGEVALCQHFLIDQVQTIRPQVIFCLGKFALLCLLGYDGPVGKARGKEFSWRGIPVIASFHPAYYLRTPSKKNAAWQDLIRLQKLLEELKK